MTDPLMNEADTAVFLGVEPKTLRNWRSKREGPPYVKVGRFVRYNPRDLGAWINRRTVGAS